MNNILDIKGIVEWYKNNANYPINEDFIEYFIRKGILQSKQPHKYSIDEFNDLMLEKQNEIFSKNNDGKYVVKKNRIPLIDKIQGKQNDFALNKGKETNIPIITQKDIKENIQTTKQEKKPLFKLAKLNGNKLKLIKL